jgi:hypothetical protein
MRVRPVNDTLVEGSTAEMDSVRLGRFAVEHRQGAFAHYRRSRRQIPAPSRLSQLAHANDGKRRGKCEQFRGAIFRLARFRNQITTS